MRWCLRARVLRSTPNFFATWVYVKSRPRVKDSIAASAAKIGFILVELYVVQNRLENKAPGHLVITHVNASMSILRGRAVREKLHPDLLHRHLRAWHRLEKVFRLSLEKLLLVHMWMNFGSNLYYFHFQVDSTLGTHNMLTGGNVLVPDSCFLWHDWPKSPKSHIQA